MASSPSNISSDVCAELVVVPVFQFGEDLDGCDGSSAEHDGCRVTRAPGAFVVGPWSEPVEDAPTQHTVHWRVVTEDGSRDEAFATAPSDASDHLLPRAVSLVLGADPFASRAVTLFAVRESSADTLMARATEPGAPARTGQTLGLAYQRGSGVSAFAVSLDGERGLYVSGHIGVDITQAFLLDGEAAPVASERLGTVNMDCVAALPTEHGAAFSLFDGFGATGSFRLAELAADGSVATDLTLEPGALAPATSQPVCPRVSRVRDGYLVASNLVDGFGIHVLRDGHDDTLVPAPPLGEDDRAPLWLGEAASGDVLALVREDSGEPRIARIARDGTWAFIPGDLPALLYSVAAEPERLFVVGRPDEQPGSAYVLYEIGCGENPRRFQRVAGGRAMAD